MFIVLVIFHLAFSSFYAFLLYKSLDSFLFIKIAIWPVSDTIYGIEPFPAFTQLVVCAALLAATLVVSEVVLYMKKYRSA